MALIEVNRLNTCFETYEGIVNAVDGVSFSIEPEKTLGVVGESGCGKSITARSIMGLVPSPPGKIVSGEIYYKANGHKVNGDAMDLVQLDPKGEKMREIRGNEIAMIFQEPMTALNPSYTIGNQIMEAIILHQKLSRKDARDRAIGMLQKVGIPSPSRRIKEFPHQLSGGMRQRAMIAMALSCHPNLLIADEPTTALDVTIQAQVLSLMNDLKSDYKTAIMFITHDLGVIADMADDIIVMYLGKIVEKGSVLDIFDNPLHPYTLGLMNSIPSLETPKDQRLIPIEGMVPDPYAMPLGCGFHPRCPRRMDRCKKETPFLEEKNSGHEVSCWLYDH